MAVQGARQEPHHSLRRHKALVLAALLVCAAAAWALTAYQAREMQGMPGMAGAPPAEMAAPAMAPMEPGRPAAPSEAMAEDMAAPPPGLALPGAGLSPAGLLALPVFLATWLVMMVAMMFPAVAPMVLLFGAVARGQRARGERPTPVPLFLVGYLAIWTAMGLGAYALLSLVAAVTGRPAMMLPFGAVGCAAALVLAGLYQLTPLKRVCLDHCRSPLSLLMHHWRPGSLGAVRMGIHHGAYCVGCCWGLMLVLLAVGMMHLGWMALLALVIFVEKVLTRGELASRVVGGLLILAGLALLTQPALPLAPMG